MNNKAQIGLSKGKKVMLALGGLGIIALVIVIVLTSMQNLPAAASSESFSTTILADVSSAQTLDGVPEGIGATVKNQTWLEFDGINDWINGTSDYITGNDFTLITWMNIAQNGTVDDLIGEGLHFSGSPSTEYDWGFYTNADNLVTIISNASGTSISYNIVGLSTYINDFHQYVIHTNETYFATYIDSVYKNSRDTLVGDKSSNHDFMVGYTIHAGRWFNGSLADTMLFNRMLEPEEIELFYNESKLGNDWGKRVPELTYHYLNDSIGTYNVNNSNFRLQMDYLNNSGFETVTYKQYKQWVDGSFNMPKKPVIIMVDDAFLSTMDFKSVMDEYDFIGVSAVPSGDIGNSNRLSWDNVTQLINGGWEIASHTVTQPDMKTKSISQRADEFQNSLNDIEGNVSYKVTSFVFPLNSQNITLQTECQLYYDVCSGDSQESTTLKKYNYQNSDYVIKGTNRISIQNRTNFDLRFYNYSLLSNPDDSRLFNWNLNENQGTTAYDQSGNSNDGTITGASWADDGVDITLTKDVDYSTSGATFIILNAEYAWSQILTNYNRNILIGSGESITDGIESFFSNASTWFALLAVVVIISIVVIIMKSVNGIDKIGGL